VLAFIVLPTAVVLLMAGAVRIAWQRAGSPEGRANRAAGLVLIAGLAWMALTWSLAASGLLLQFNRRPPPLAGLFAAIVLLALALAFSRIGRRLAALPLWWLVGAQGFRFPLELAMHRMAERGIMPAQMSYDGYNFDILTGITALVVAVLIRGGRASRQIVLAWNVMGLALLVNVVTIAIASTPMFRAFGDDRLNVWVMFPPFVWLPTVLVLAALAGQLIVFRALSALSQTPAPSRRADTVSPGTGAPAPNAGPSAPTTRPTVDDAGPPGP
jgi:hypothetical protein